MNRRGFLRMARTPAAVAFVPVGALAVAACERRKEQFKVEMPKEGEMNWGPILDKAVRDIEVAINELRNAS